jgi:hypothetical protein
MCDPISIAGLVATAGSTVANSMAAGRANRAREDVLAAERIRQGGYDQEAQALNAKSQDEYTDFGAKQEAKAQSLGDYFAAPPTDGLSMSAAAALPSTDSNDVVTREMDKQSGKAKAFTDQQAGALGNLRAFGDVLGDTTRTQARNAAQIGQIGGFKRGSSNVTPLELDKASQAGSGLKMFGDILGGLGSIGTSYGLTRGAGAAAQTGASLAPASSMRPMARPLSLYGGM